MLVDPLGNLTDLIIMMAGKEDRKVLEIYYHWQDSHWASILSMV